MNASVLNSRCPLCESDQLALYHRDAKRPYQQCANCQLVFVEHNYHLNSAAEKAEYDLHQNHPGDPGYRNFLQRLATPLATRLAAGSRGLDFGCGPGPTLSLMLEELGHTVSLYDIFYAVNERVWQCRYQFITATEVVEHLSQPGRELLRLWRHLEPGGILAVMTKRVINPERFASWHYKNDPTHICFFSEQSFEWLGHQWGVKPEFIGGDIVLFTKPAV